MGLFKKLKDATGDVLPELLANGLLGRASIASITSKHLAIGIGGLGDDEGVYEIELEVAIDGEEPFRATCHHKLRDSAAEHLVPNQTFVAARVDPDDHSKVAIDFASEPPVVTMPAAAPGQLTTYTILEQGVPCRVKVAGHMFMGMRNAQGVDMHAIKYTVTQDGKAPYEMQLTQPVPAEGLPLLQEGADLPAKVLADNDQTAVVDWDAARAEQ